MLKKCLKIISQLVLVSIFGMIVSFAVVWGHLLESRVPSAEDFKTFSGVTHAYPVSSKKAIKKSSNSAVRIISFNPVRGEVSVSSGTYFEHKERHYILTVRHGIASLTCEYIQIEVDNSLHPCDSVVSHDDYSDYVILSTGQIVGRQPIKFPNDFVTGYSAWIKTALPLEPLIYTGYPNTIGPVTLSGRVMGVSSDEYIYFNSYAWSGSSGSGVFNSKGKLVGYIVALDVGRTEYGMDVLENVILVVPHYRVDWTPILRGGL